LQNAFERRIEAKRDGGYSLVTYLSECRRMAIQSLQSVPVSVAIV
jgi:hypothetical protein